MLNQFTASLWGDEAFSAILSMKSIPEIVRIIIKDTSPPLFNISEHLAFQLFGTSELVIRFHSFFYYLIAIFFVYKLASYWWNRQTGILAAILTFLNPFFFIYAFEGRMYSILAATVAASMYFFASKKWVGYVLASTLALYSHHFAIFALFTQGLWFLYELFVGKRKVALQMLKSFLAIGVLYSPWLIPLYRQTTMVGGGFWLGKPTFFDLFGLFGKYLGAGIAHPLAILAVGVSLGILAFRNWAKDGRKTVFLLTWFLIPIALTWTVSQFFQSIFYDRYLLYTIPGITLLLASNRRKLSQVLIVGLIGLFLVIDANYFTHPTKRPFRELAAYVQNEKKGDDILINWNSGAHHIWEAKYYGISAPLYVPEGTTLPYYVGTALMTESDLISAIPTRFATRAKVNRLGIITSGSVEEVELDGWEQESFRQFGDLKIIWLTKL